MARQPGVARRRRRRRRRSPRPSTAPAGISTQTSQGAVLAVPPRLPGAHSHLPPAARIAAAGRRRPRPADGGDAAGADRRHGQAACRARRAAAALQGHRRRADHRAGPGLPAAQPPRSARRRRSRPQNAAIMPTGTFARTLAPQLAAIATGALGASAQPGAQNGSPVAGAGPARPRPARRPAARPRRSSAPIRRVNRVRALAARARSSSSTTSPTRSTPRRGTRSTPRRCTSCSRSRAR